MTGIPLMIAFVVCIVLMILAISKLKIHPFLSILAVSLLLAILGGIPLPDIPTVIGQGFSGTFTSIGIVIILGALVGTLLEMSGAALKMSDCVVRLVGKSIRSWPCSSWAGLCPSPCSAIRASSS